LYDGPFHFYDSGFDACQISNGDFVIVGSTWQLGPYVLRINAIGDTVWTRWFNLPGFAKTVVSTDDGGIVFTGHGDSAYTIKLDSNGNIVWQKFYGGYQVQIEDMRKTQDGGYVACGGDWTNTQTSNGYVLKIDSLGNLQWQVSHPGIFKQYSSIEEAFNGGYVITGSTSGFPGDILTRINSTGDIIWERQFLVSDSAANPQVIEKLSQGYLIGGIAAADGTPDWSPFFVRTDTNVVTYYTKVFPSSLPQGFDMITDFSTDRYVISLYIDSIYTTQLRYAKALITDSSGNILRERVFPSISSSHFYSIVPIANGDLLFTGYWRNHSTPPFDDVYAARTDSLLNVPPNFIGITSQQNEIPIEFKLYQNYPNPFNPITTIKYDIPVGTRHGVFVQLKIYDITGREVFGINEYKQAGSYSVTFDGTNFASGLYLYRIESGNFVETKKMVLIK
jgi:hypothetical protein